MKNKKIKIIKQNFIGFIISGIIFGSIGAYAAITFPSNEVSFDSSNSTLKSTNVKDAIDELYKKCTQTTADKIIDNAGLEKDPYEDRYFFVGANVNNYITFSGETWRILSVEGDGRIKIVKDSLIEDRAWDTSEVNGNNNWARPATLNTYLNETYYETLSDKDKIVTSMWNIGSLDYEDTSLSSSIMDEKSNTWSGNIALVTANEYIRTNSNTSSCGNVNQIWNADSGQCKGTTWLYLNDYWWTLSSRSNDSNNVLYVSVFGSFDHYGLAILSSYGVRPALYLKSDIKITGGDGSQSNPYTIE